MSAVLAIETSSHVGAVCLLRDGVAFKEIVRDNTKLSAWVVPAIDRVLRSAGLSAKALDAIAYGTGPGAFTGVRTACATAQAIAYAVNKPLQAVNSLTALASVFSTAYSSYPQFNWAKEEIKVILDARMSEAFTAGFIRASDKSLRMVSDTALQPIDQITFSENAAVLGSGAVIVARRMKLPEAVVNAITELTYTAENVWAESIARIAAILVAQGDAGIDPLTAEPTYVRNNVAKTEAERAEEARRDTFVRSEESTV